MYEEESGLTDDFESVRKLQELGEHERVAEMCRLMIGQHTGSKNVDKVTSLREILITSLIEITQDDDADTLETEFDLLFENQG